MKKYEKFLVRFIASVFAIYILFPIAHITSVIFTLTVWLLAISYLFGGYWLFNTDKNEKTILSIVAGIVFLFGIFPIPLAIQLEFFNDPPLFPLLTGLLALGLAVYIFWNRKNNKVSKDILFIFYRACVISVISFSFLYTPMSFKPFRTLLFALNKGDTPKTKYLFMIDYSYAFIEALGNNDCDAAIQFAIQSNQYGKQIIDINETEKLNIQNRDDLFFQLLNNKTAELSSDIERMIDEYEGEESLYNIGRTYAHLYEAYACKANSEFNIHNYKEALTSYITAYKYLTAVSIKQGDWKDKVTDALNDIATCYEKLNKVELAGSFYTKAIENHQKVNDNVDMDVTLAQLYSNLAHLFSIEHQFDYSNQILHMVNNFLLKKPEDTELKHNLIKNYQGLTTNYLLQDSLQQALFYIEKAENLVDKNSLQYCSVQFTVALCQFRLNQFEAAALTIKNCIPCFKKNNDNNLNLNIAECLIVQGYIELILGQFDDARKSLNRGLELTKQNFGTNNIKYANYLKTFADLDKMTGNYPIAAKQYQEALKIYNNQENTQRNAPTSILIGLSDLEIIQDDFLMAQKHADEAMEIASNINTLTSPNSTNILNQSAYVNYHLGNYNTAEKLYQDVLQINKDYNIQNATTTASSLNGLGLVEMNRNNFSKSHTYFQESLLLHQQIYSDNNPFTAVVYLNYALLNIVEGNLSEAEDKLNKSLEINRHFFEADHNIFADLFIAFGDLAKKKGRHNIAKDNYAKALNIYKIHFDDRHWKVKEAQLKLK